MTAAQIPLSLLDLVRVKQGSDATGALTEAQQIATHIDRLGFNRYWVAEHHNMQSIASAATSVVLAHAGQHTKRIRIGSGGIMLPNHSPYIIAEQFGTLAALYPGRIDLGLGRAPGTDQATTQAIRTPPGAAENFPNDIQELMHWFKPDDAPSYIRAWPAAGAQVDMWVLGSSTYGAMLAAEFGLPYAFASHFAPDHLDAALQIYRSRFKPSDARATPHAMVAVTVICADTTAEAKRLFTTAQMSFTGIFRNMRGLSQPPIDDIETYWTPSEKAQVNRMLGCSMVGNPAEVKAGLEALQARTKADEFIIVTDIFDAEARKRSLSLTADLWGLTA